MSLTVYHIHEIKNESMATRSACVTTEGTFCGASSNNRKSICFCAMGVRITKSRELLDTKHTFGNTKEK